MESKLGPNTVYCPSCRQSTKNGDDGIKKCTQWLDGCSLSDNESSTSDSTDNKSQTEDNDGSEKYKKENNAWTTDAVVRMNSQASDLIWGGMNSENPNQYEHIRVFKSQNVHIGNVTNINGPLYLDSFSSRITENTVVNNPSNNSFSTKPPAIVSRRTWLAQPPVDPGDVMCLPKAVKYVIICHTATEESFTRTENNLNVRLIQQFHVESRKWNDIGYNFLIGADGSVYEGRGWRTVGAHTYGWNCRSVAVAFVGWYLKKLPPKVALEAAQVLIRHGVEIGAIAEDYALLGACQCQSTQSPGERLFEEIKTWERWDGSVDPANPPDFSDIDD